MSKRTGLAVVAALCLTSSVGLALLREAVASPEDLAVGVPRHGDRVRYSSGDGSPGYSFAWVGSAVTYDEWGRDVRVDRLLVDAFLGGTDEVGYLPGALEPLYVEGPGLSYRWGFEYPSLLYDHSFEQETNYTQRLYRPSSHILHCVARAGWQGLPFADLEGKKVEELCPQGGIVGPLRPDGTEQLAGTRVWRFSVEHEDLGRLGFDFAAGIPYPVRLVATDLVTGEESFAELAGYERGTGEAIALAGAPPTPGPLPPSLFSRFGRDWPLDGPHDLPLTSRQARAELEGSPLSTEYRAWTRDHPDWVPMRAAFFAHDECDDDEDALTSWRWSFDLDGRDGTMLAASASTSDLCQPVHGVLPTVAHEPWRDSRMDSSAMAWDVDEGWALRSPPAQSITVAGALGIFEATRRAGSAPADSIAFQLDGYAAGDVAPVHTVSVAATRSLPGGESRQEAVVLDMETGRILSQVWTRSVTVENDATLSANVPLLSSEIPSTSGGFVQTLEYGVTAAPEGAYWAASAVSALVLALLAVASRLPAAGAFLYTRLSRTDVLEQRTRRAICEALTTRPGLSTGEVQAAVGAGSGTVLYHLEVLTRAGHLTRVQLGRSTRYFPAGHAPMSVLREEAIRLEGGAEARVLGVLRAAPGTHASQVARDLGITRASAHEVVARLERRGLVERRREGRRVLLFARG